MGALFLGYGVNSNALLLYSTTNDIRVTNTTKTNNHNKFTILVKNFTEGPAIDYHYEDKKLCWTDHGQENLQCADYNGFEVKNRVITISNMN